MKKIALVLLFSLSATMMWAQRVVSGTAVEEDSKEPLPSATVKLLKTDSTLVKGVLTNVNGGFKVTAPADGRYILRVSCVGFKNYTKRITVSGGKDVALGKISLKSDAIMLKGATVTANVAKVTAKADTLEYNAAAYRTPEGSAIEELVKRLPGVTVSDDGKITHNGKEVKKSALFTVVSQYGFGIDLKDSSRVAAQVVSGIGFLGAGTIIFQKNMVRGLTTAAGLWVTAAIGLACGTGLFAVAAITTGLVLIGLESLHTLIPQLGKAAVQLGFTTESKKTVSEVLNRLKQEDISISSFEMKIRSTKYGEVFDVTADIRIKRGGHNERILNLINEFDDVTISHLE